MKSSSKLYVAGCRWQVAGSRWQVTVGRWKVADGRWQVAGGRSHLAEMSRFTRFARHKMSATRHLKLFSTPG